MTISRTYPTRIASALATVIAATRLLGCVPAESDVACIGVGCDDRDGGTSDGGSGRDPGRDSGRTDDDGGGDDASADGSGSPSDGGTDSGGGLSPCDPRSCDEATAAGDALADTDGDRIPDCLEGTGDADEDGRDDCDDTDADGDGLPDNEEGSVDTDGDTIPDFRDPDGDGDTIPDRYEGPGDPDLDGRPNYADDDSDGDGWPDAAEYGRDPASGLGPIDRDGDGDPDTLDLDADGDGLLDADELGCPTYTSRTEADSDGDGFTDLVEQAFGADGCDPDSTIEDLVDFYFELPFLGDRGNDTLEFGTNASQGDVFFNVDTTGSMSGAISNLRSALSSSIIPATQAALTSAGFGVGQFDDFPTSGFGSPPDQPFWLRQAITTDVGAAQRAADRLELHNGADGPESGYEALYQIATGAGRVECSASVPPGPGGGTIGGAGFRPGSVPVVVHITDALSHARDDGGYPCGATREETYTALNTIGARVIGVVSSGDARRDLEQIAARTNSRVPACAWDGARPGGCGAGQCCTGNGGAGRAPDGDGLCSLVYDINSNGSGLGTSVVSGISALLNFAPVDVTTRIRRDDDEFARSGIDTGLFLKSVFPVESIPGPAACAGAPTAALADFDGDGVNDGFTDVSPGSRLLFAVDAYNDFVRATLEPQVFVAYIDVVGNGTAVLDTRVVSILVPPDIKQ